MRVEAPSPLHGDATIHRPKTCRSAIMTAIHCPGSDMHRILFSSLFALQLLLSAPALADVRIEMPWSRATPPGAAVAGGFMTLQNEGMTDDRLLSVSSEVAASVEIHQMSMEDGAMQMRELVDGLPLPAGESVALAPGGFHLMFIEPKPLREGDRFLATLHFEHAGSREVEFMTAAAGSREPPSGPPLD
jgi:copper(I)-binding protein